MLWWTSGGGVGGRVTSVCRPGTFPTFRRFGVHSPRILCPDENTGARGSLGCAPILGATDELSERKRAELCATRPSDGGTRVLCRSPDYHTRTEIWRWSNYQICFHSDGHANTCRRVVASKGSHSWKPVSSRVPACEKIAPDSVQSVQDVLIGAGSCFQFRWLQFRLHQPNRVSRQDRCTRTKFIETLEAGG